MLCLTWWHAGGDGGGRELSLAFGGHGRYLDGVGGEGGEPCHLVLLSQVGQIMGHPCVGPIKLFPGDAIAWRGSGRVRQRSVKGENDMFKGPALCKIHCRNVF